jgi:hypothetical protein
MLLVLVGLGIKFGINIANAPGTGELLLQMVNESMKKIIKDNKNFQIFFKKSSCWFIYFLNHKIIKGFFKTSCFPWT